MNLRRQLLLVSLLLLSLPWAGCQFVQEMEGALQHGQEQALLATSRAVATVLKDKPHLLYSQLSRSQETADSSLQLYARDASAPIIVDGYADGWDNPVHRSFGPVSYRALTRNNRLYLLISVTDSQVVYHDPRRLQSVTGDRLILRTAHGREYLIATAAPGPVQARYRGSDGEYHWETRIRGHWQDTLQGYTIELEMPLSILSGRVGFAVIDDRDEADSQVQVWHGTIDPAFKHLPPRLIFSPKELQSLVASFSDSGLQLRIVNRDRWIISQAGDLRRLNTGNSTSNSNVHWLVRALYRAVLNAGPVSAAPVAEAFGRYVGSELDVSLQGTAAAQWYLAGDNNQQKRLRAAAPVFNGEAVVGAVIAEQNNERYLSLTDQAFSRLLYLSLIAMAASGLGLLGYASWLSWRIRRLSQASREVINDDGSLRDNFPASTSSDELGDLSRQYGQLLSQLREYTDYLRSLSRKLSHELRTPIAVIQSSLDNMQPEGSDNTYLQRAGEGITRLNRILTAMSEASGLEEGIHNNIPEDFDLVALCHSMFAAYREIYPDRDLHLDCELLSFSIHGVPDLVVQMLDKLMDNAHDFSPPGGHIALEITEAESGIELCVRNQGPQLPQAMQAQLFESMVSVRERSDQVHLGLGLHIVRLIVEFHRGSIRAENLTDGSGVKFCAWFPRRSLDSGLERQHVGT
jgi:two-component system sensor histidine kinase ChvG